MFENSGNLDILKNSDKRSKLKKNEKENYGSTIARLIIFSLLKNQKKKRLWLHVSQFVIGNCVWQDKFWVLFRLNEKWWIYGKKESEWTTHRPSDKENNSLKRFFKRFTWAYSDVAQFFAPLSEDLSNIVNFTTDFK